MKIEQHPACWWSNLLYSRQTSGTSTVSKYSDYLNLLVLLLVAWTTRNLCNISSTGTSSFQYFNSFFSSCLYWFKGNASSLPKVLHWLVWDCVWGLKRLWTAKQRDSVTSTPPVSILVQGTPREVDAEFVCRA